MNDTLVILPNIFKTVVGKAFTCYFLKEIRKMFCNNARRAPVKCTCVLNEKMWMGAIIPF